MSDYCLPDEDDAETLAHLLDRVIDIGLVVSGDIRLSVADIDLVYVGLKLLVTSIDKVTSDGAIEKSFLSARPDRR